MFKHLILPVFVIHIYRIVQIEPKYLQRPNYFLLLGFFVEKF